MLRSTSRERLAACQRVRDWPMDRLSRAWLAWIESRTFVVREQLLG